MSKYSIYNNINNNKNKIKQLIIDGNNNNLYFNPGSSSGAIKAQNMTLKNVKLDSIVSELQDFVLFSCISEDPSNPCHFNFDNVIARNCGYVCYCVYVHFCIQNLFFSFFCECVCTYVRIKHICIYELWKYK